MSVDVLEQVRQLAEAFDEYVGDVTVDEAVGRIDQAGEPGWAEPTLHEFDRQPVRHRLGLVAAAVLLVGGLVGALAWVDRGSQPPTSSSAPAAPAAPVGQFVWPAPPRDYTTLAELVSSFTAEVLGWDAFDIEGELTEELQPQSFALSNTELDASVALIAIPSSEGWGFVQIGGGMSASDDHSGGLVLDFPTRRDAASYSISIRLSDGSVVDATADASPVELADARFDRLLSALVVGRDVDGRAITVTGGQFNVDPGLPPTTPEAVPDSVPAEAADLAAPYGPLDFATSARWLPRWPAVNASSPAATTTAYGMNLCDDGYGTKVLRVDPATGPAHAYSGTLCVFVDLAEPRPDAVTTCATTTDRFNYARCQRRTDQTDSAGPGTAVSTVATAEQQRAMAAFPTATAWDQAEVFAADVSAVAGQDNPVQWFDDSVAVGLTAAAPDSYGVDPAGVCFTITLPGADATGCVGQILLSTGLAYGAFQDGDGPIEIIGIVPDAVTAVEIGDTTITPVNNVWHYTATSVEPLTITVRSADGRSATTS